MDPFDIARRLAWLTFRPLGDGWYLVDDGDERWRVAVAGGRDATWVFVDGQVARIEAGAASDARPREGPRRRGRHGADAGNRRRDQHRRRPGRQRRRHLIVLEAMKMELPIKVAAQRHREGGALRQGRSGPAGRQPARDRVMRVPADGHRSSKSARATACRTSAPRSATADKIAFVDRLSDAGHQVIEVSAFVSPKWVPQMADAAEVFAGITRRPGTRYTALVPNRQGLERAIAAGVSEVAIFAAASETFSRRNINQSIDESLANYAAVCADARAAGLRVRGYLSTCFVCPFEGPVDPAARRRHRGAAARHRRLRSGDQRHDWRRASGRWCSVSSEPSAPARAALQQIALHFHDTRGTALANVLAGLDYGVTTFDSSAGGLGGCPFAPGAAGNLATEDLLFMLNGLGIETGVSIDGVAAASRVDRDEARSRAAVALPAGARLLTTQSEICKL